VRTAIITRHYDPVETKIKIMDESWNDWVDECLLMPKPRVDGANVEDRGELDEIIPENESTGSSSDDGEIVKESDFGKHAQARSQDDRCKEIARSRHGMLIMYDGALLKSKSARDIVRACEDNGNVIVGISKDSALRVINDISYESVLDAYTSQHPGFTGYVMYRDRAGNIYDGFSSSNRIGACFARLHPNAQKWFRVDFQSTEMMDLPEILRTIACYSQVNTMPGTPFPLMINAHEIAVKIRQLRPAIEPLVMKCLKDEGFPDGYTLRGLTDVNGKLISGSHHDYLDNFTRVSNKE